MLRVVLASVVAVLALSLSSVASAQSEVLPTIAADGRMTPLTIGQLNADERAVYATLNEDDARRYLFTRGYLRYARLVVSGDLPPLELPPLPARVNWGRHLLSAEEATSILDVALGMKYVARQQQTREQIREELRTQ